MNMPELVSAEQVAKAVGVHRITIIRWVEAGQFPPPIRFGRRCLRWRVRDIDAWLTAQQQPTHEVTQ